MIYKRHDALETRSAKVMTLEEVSRYLHVHRSTVYRLLKRGEIPAFRIGSDWRFNIETIDIWRSRNWKRSTNFRCLDRIFNWPHLMVVTSSSNSCSVDPSQRYIVPLKLD